MADKYTHDELVGLVKSPGWVQDGQPVQGTLEDALKAAHQSRADGKPAGLIAQAETAIELDMIQVEKLWLYLGLPV